MKLQRPFHLFIILSDTEMHNSLKFDTVRIVVSRRRSISDYFNSRWEISVHRVFTPKRLRGLASSVPGIPFRGFGLESRPGNRRAARYSSSLSDWSINGCLGKVNCGDPGFHVDPCSGATFFLLFTRDSKRQQIRDEQRCQAQL